MAQLGNKPESVLQQLHLSRELFERQASFYAGYAEMLESKRTNTADELTNDAWDRIANPHQAWKGSAAIASTYRLAAENAVLVDTRWSMELAVRSALAYLDAGMAFGLFLITGVLDDRTLQRNLRTLPVLLQPLTAAGAAAPLSDPVQRSYLAMTLNARPWIRTFLNRSSNNPLTSMIEGLDAYALQPVGPQSIPMEAYLGFARAIRFVEWSDDRGDNDLPRAPAGRDSEQLTVSPDQERDGLAEIATRCAALGRTQAETLRTAMRNRYLWEHGAAPVNIVDLEYVAVYGNAMRRYRSASWSRAFRRRVTAELDDDPLAQISIWVAGRMNRLIPEVAEHMLELLRRDEPPTNAGL